MKRIGLLVAGPAQKRALRERFGAELCETEAAGVVLTCKRAKVPCLLIKTVSDALEAFYRAFAHSAALCLELADQLIREM